MNIWVTYDTWLAVCRPDGHWECITLRLENVYVGASRWDVLGAAERQYRVEHPKEDIFAIGLRRCERVVQEAKPKRARSRKTSL